MKRPAKTSSCRSGFALAAAVFVLVILSGIALDAALRSRAERAIAWNVSVEVRARAASRAGLAEALLRLRALQARTVGLSGSDPTLFDAWNRVDTLTAHDDGVALQGGGVYRVQIRDADSRLPINEATAGELSALFSALGADDGLARSVASAMISHRNELGPYRTLAELKETDGFGSLPPGTSDLLTFVGTGHVNLNTASEPVLRSLPAMGEEAVSWVLRRRATGVSVHSLIEVAEGVSSPARARIQAEFPALSARASYEPVQLEVLATGEVSGARMQAVLTAVAVRAGRGIQIISAAENG